MEERGASLNSVGKPSEIAKRIPMNVIAIIPTRMASTRFPGKPLVDILGLPMIEHVRRRVELCNDIHDVIVATCNKEIYNIVTENGGHAVMTSADHERCTDRVAEAALLLEADIIINVQGDEPLVRPDVLKDLLKPFNEKSDIVCTNLMSEITDAEFNSPDVVKTVFDLEGNAVYFSREPIPSKLKAPDTNYKKYKQLGIIAFQNLFLQQFANLQPSPLEIVESVDMMRAIEHGYKVRMVETGFNMMGVDTPADLKLVIELMRKDDLFGSY